MQAACLASTFPPASPTAAPATHRPVMCEEVVTLLAPCLDGDLLDGTVGRGGHAAALLAAGRGRLLGLDRDPDAVAASRTRLAPFAVRARVVQADFSRAADALDQAGWSGADGVLLDLGFSSPQVEDPGRGFSFLRDGPLDMRMNPTGGRTAADIVNMESETELRRILREWGEERAAGAIARAIVRVRESASITTTAQLAGLVERVVRRAGRGARVHPATRTFQALRIAANEELDRLATFLETGYRLLRPGGRMLILSYHSLEDRLVKSAFRRWAADCLCPPGLQVCACGWNAQVRRVTSKPLTPSAAEVFDNPRARSARLRAVERCGGVD